MTSVEATIAEIEEARRAATAELIGFRAGEKVMAARAEELVAEAAGWERRAEDAVRAGDDALAREALVHRGWAIAELAQVRADREAQARIAAELLRGRRELDAKLASLKLRAGTVAAGIAAARSGATGGDVFDRFEEAERRIEEQSIADELTGAEIDPPDLAQQRLQELERTIRADGALAELKRRMK